MENRKVVFVSIFLLFVWFLIGYQPYISRKKTINVVKYLLLLGRFRSNGISMILQQEIAKLQSICRVFSFQLSVNKLLYFEEIIQHNVNS